jgi:hypothetical protein
MWCSFSFTVGRKIFKVKLFRVDSIHKMYLKLWFSESIVLHKPSVETVQCCIEKYREANKNDHQNSLCWKADQTE